MMSKERLEEIVKKISEQTFDRIIVPQTKITIEYQDIKFLINAITKQTERVQELEELLTQIKYDKEAHIALSEKYLKKQLQNKRYREAIEKIKLNVKICGNEEYFPKVVEEIVNEALEGEE